jgi:prefoldin subunit 5
VEREERTGKAIEALTGRLAEMEKERLRAEGEMQKQVAALGKALGEVRDEIRTLKTEQRPPVATDGLRMAEKVK